MEKKKEMKEELNNRQVRGNENRKKQDDWSAIRVGWSTEKRKREKERLFRAHIRLSIFEIKYPHRGGNLKRSFSFRPALSYGRTLHKRSLEVVFA